MEVHPKKHPKTKTERRRDNPLDSSLEGRLTEKKKTAERTKLKRRHSLLCVINRLESFVSLDRNTRTSKHQLLQQNRNMQARKLNKAVVITQRQRKNTSPAPESTDLG
ncbi:hypothetical protein N665_0400s0021 [Sinapis alba]|nr:hypothetical protein N665_0400s0021 [Sinapis alba]